MAYTSSIQAPFRALEALEVRHRIPDRALGDRLDYFEATSPLTKTGRCLWEGLFFPILHSAAGCEHQTANWRFLALGILKHYGVRLAPFAEFCVQSPQEFHLALPRLPWPGSDLCDTRPSSSRPGSTVPLRVGQKDRHPTGTEQNSILPYIDLFLHAPLLSPHTPTVKHPRWAQRRAL